MIQSMTGFGKSEVSLSNKKITLEIKSLNSKNFDLYVRIPSQYREKELDLRKMISSALGRGKVDFSLYVENNDGETAAQINHPVVRNYIKSLKSISQTGMHDEFEMLKIAITFPDALKTEREEIDESEFSAIQDGVEEALEKLNAFRSDEGESLKKDFELRIKNLSTLLDEVEKIDPERLENTRERLQSAVAELHEKLDQNRFEQELIYYIEKYDITEEKTRLKNHLDYFSKCLASADSNGKKLNFIGQEIGREINTIGSKSNYAPMQKLVVQMKDELEKIKEQMLNVL